MRLLLAIAMLLGSCTTVFAVTLTPEEERDVQQEAKLRHLTPAQAEELRQRVELARIGVRNRIAQIMQGVAADSQQREEQDRQFRELMMKSINNRPIVIERTPESEIRVRVIMQPGCEYYGRYGLYGWGY